TRFIPSGVAKAVLGVPGLHLVSKNQRALVDLLATNVRYDTSQADDLLRGTGIHCPSFETYVDHLVSFVRRRVEEGRARADLGRLRVPHGKAGQAFSSCSPSPTEMVPRAWSGSCSTPRSCWVVCWC